VTALFHGYWYRVAYVGCPGAYVGCPGAYVGCPGAYVGCPGVFYSIKNVSI